jgi:hypothetical protein
MNDRSNYAIGGFQGMDKWRDTGTGIAVFGALPLMVFMHLKTGYRWLAPGRIIGISFFLFMINAIANFHLALPFIGMIGATHETRSLGYVAWVFPAYALWQRRQRLSDLRKGVRWHSFSPGVSYFEFLPLRTDLVYRFVDPGAALLFGLVLHKLGFTVLGLWICFSAGCLFIVGNHLYEKQLNRDLDTLDTGLEAEMQAAVVEHFEGEGQGTPRSLKETGGIPTGADAGIEAEIAKRKREAAAKRAKGDGTSEVKS